MIRSLGWWLPFDLVVGLGLICCLGFVYDLIVWVCLWFEFELFGYGLH